MRRFGGHGGRWQDRVANSARRSPAARAGLSALAVLAGVFAVAVGSSRSLARAGRPGRLPQPSLPLGDLGVGLVVLALATVAGLAYVIWGGRRSRRRDEEPEWVPEQIPVPWRAKLALLALALLPVAALVTGLALLARGAAGQAGPAVRGGPAVPGGAAPHRAGQASPAGPHWWFWAVLAGLITAALVIVAVRRWLRRRPDGWPRAAAPRPLSAMIEESLAEIERERDPRRAVIRAYVGMEQALARHGLGRRRFETPQEYLARALVVIRASRPAGERLTGLFQRARFSEHPIVPQMKRDAIAALTAVRDELAETGQ